MSDTATQPATLDSIQNLLVQLIARTDAQEIAIADLRAAYEAGAAARTRYEAGATDPHKIAVAFDELMDKVATYRAQPMRPVLPTASSADAATKFNGRFFDLTTGKYGRAYFDPMVGVVFSPDGYAAPAVLIPGTPTTRRTLDEKDANDQLVKIEPNIIDGYAACWHCDNTSLGIDGPCSVCGLPPHVRMPGQHTLQAGDDVIALDGRALRLVRPATWDDELEALYKVYPGLFPAWDCDQQTAAGTWEGADLGLLGGAVLRWKPKAPQAHIRADCPHPHGCTLCAPPARLL